MLCRFALGDLAADVTASATAMTKVGITMKNKAMQSNCRHFLDAEVQAFYDLLHDDKLKQLLMAKFATRPGPIIIHLHVTKSRCDLCCQLIVLKYLELVERFHASERGLQIVVSASAPYGSEANCLGLNHISRLNPNIHFRFVHEGIASNEQQTFGLM